MRSIVRLAFPLLVSMLPMLVHGADAHTEAVALLEAMNAKLGYQEAVRQMERQLGAGGGLLSSELMDRIFDEMAKIYSEVYTAEELAAMRAFYESPAGKAFLQKQPLLTEKYVEVLTRLATEYVE